jgi:hypothetical protein
MARLSSGVGLSLSLALLPAPSFAVGAWTGGQDILHVPISWCALQGSPAADNPDITPVGGTAADTDTDSVLWRRHERPTDNIWVPQAGVSFRSAINDTWGTLNFPIIADPDTSFGNPGDVRGEDLSVSSTEFDAVVNACETAWAGLGRAGIGITAVNVNLFVNAAGDYLTNTTPGMEEATPIGWGGCLESATTGLCVAPYDGRIAVADNRYLYPTVPDRTWPPSPADPGGNFQYSVTDPLDQLVAHELGHALGLAHRNDATLALMFPGQQDNDGDSDTDNVQLNAAEVTQSRTAAGIVPGLEMDPPNRFVPGPFVRTRLPDALDEDVEEARPWLNLGAATVMLNHEDGAAFIDVQLGGVTTARGVEPFEAWVLVDADAQNPGAPLGFLREIGLPEPQGLEGADLVLRARFREGRVLGEGWRVQQGDPIQIRDERLTFDLLRLVLHPYYAAGLEGPDREAGLFDVIRVALPPELALFELDRPFRIQALLVAENRVVDRLEDEGFGREAVLELPSFPHCYPQEDATPGRTTPIRFEGLRANRGVHGLIGPQEVVRGTADGEGGGVLDFPVPADARPGHRLITIGTDGTALTADCTLLVREPGEPGPGRFDPQTYSLLKSYERLLHDQQRLLALLGEIVRDAVATGAMDEAAQTRMAEGYRALLERQTVLLERFEGIVARSGGR